MPQPLLRHEDTKTRKTDWLRAFVSSWLVTAGAPAVAAQPPPSGDAGRGKELYVKYSCSACHGYDGHGGAGARLVPLPMTMTRFTAYVHNPARRMPPYTDK